MHKSTLYRRSVQTHRRVPSFFKIDHWHCSFMDKRMIKWTMKQTSPPHPPPTRPPPSHNKLNKERNKPHRPKTSFSFPKGHYLSETPAILSSWIALLTTSSFVPFFGPFFTWAMHTTGNISKKKMNKEVKDIQTKHKYLSVFIHLYNTQVTLIKMNKEVKEIQTNVNIFWPFFTWTIHR